MLFPVPIPRSRNSEIAHFLLQAGNMFRNVVGIHHDPDHTPYEDETGRAGREAEWQRKQRIGYVCRFQTALLPKHSRLTTVAQKPNIVIEQATSSYSFQVP